MSICSRCQKLPVKHNLLCFECALDDCNEIEAAATIAALSREDRIALHVGRAVVETYRKQLEDDDSEYAECIIEDVEIAYNEAVAKEVAES